MNIVVCYEGVLMARKDRPILQGFLLVHSLCQANRVSIITEATEERVNHQLKTEKLQGQIAKVVDSSVALEPIPLWQRQIELLRSEQAVDMVVTADPAVAHWCVVRGVNSLFYAHPGFNRPPQRPEIGNRSWDELLQELEHRT